MTAPAAPAASRPVAGVLWMLAAGLSFVCMTAVVRHLGTGLPAAQLRFDRDMGTKLTLADDSTVQGLSLAFSFPFHGASYSSICVCSNCSAPS